jgi:hypothetical protein
LPRKAAESGNATETPAKAPAGTPAGASGAQTAVEPSPISECQEIFDHIRRFYEGNGYYPASCFPGIKDPPALTPPNPPADLNFVIATVPNPVQTHLPLLFDRSVEAIQQAVQDEGYTYDGSWFPWDDTAKDHDSSSDEELAKALKEKQHRQPGVLVFRRGLDHPVEQRQPYSGGLIVFLVGEQPTGGIDDAQFEAALQWLTTLQPNLTKGTLRILGPTFTGSLPSLARQLQCHFVQSPGLLRSARQL